MKTFFKNLNIGLVLLLGFSFFFVAAAPGLDNKPGRYGEITATLAELQTLTDVMEYACLDIGYYVSIENLNDLLSDNTVHDFDNIDQFDGTWVIDLYTGFFHPDKVDLTSPYHLWQGPYVSYQESRITLDGDGYDRGTLLDFWGTPYYLFSPAGLVRTDEHAITLELYGDYFDMYAIVSLGPDGVKSSDDLYRTFGAPPTRLVLTSISDRSASPGDTLSLRGYNFGAAPPKTSTLFLGETPVTTIISWSDRLIEFVVPEGAGSGFIKLVKDTQESNLIYLSIEEEPTAAHDWTLYE